MKKPLALLMAALIATSTFATTGIGSAYAQDRGVRFGPRVVDGRVISRGPHFTDRNVYRGGRGYYRGGRDYYRGGRGYYGRSFYRGGRSYYGPRYGYYRRGYYGPRYGYYGPRYYYRDRSGSVAAAGIIGLATGAILGGALAQPRYAPAPRYYSTARGSDWVAYCYSKYRSYDPRTNTFLGYDGRRHYCR